MHFKICSESNMKFEWYIIVLPDNWDNISWDWPFLYKPHAKLN